MKVIKIGMDLVFYQLCETHAEPAEKSDSCHTFYHNHHSGDENDRLPVDA